MSHTFDPSILRAYDIRGIFQETLHLEDAYALGRVFATYLNKPGATIAVGRDGRLSSPALVERLIQGLVESGLNVKDIGLGPTPLLYFAQKHLGTEAAIMVSGSHNPGNYNGFKMCLAQGPLFGEDIQELGQIAQEGRWHSGEGSVESIDISDTYVAYLIDDFKKHYPEDHTLKIAWDPGNGAAGDIVTKLTRQLPGSHIVINEEIDGRFLNHHPDPSVEENLEQLKQVVKDRHCDFGLAFDGDGDRLGVVDAQGRVIWGDLLVALFAEEVLTRHPNTQIIMDIKSSKVPIDMISRLGGLPSLYRTGHSYIKAQMQKTGALLAGELSGHMFFADRYFGFDDALYAAIRFIGRFSEAPYTPEQWLDDLPQTFVSPELTFPSTSSEKFKIVAQIAEKLRAESIDFVGIDGVRIITESGWWLLRASNTQDILVARIESSSQQGLATLKESMARYLQPHGIYLP